MKTIIWSLRPIWVGCVLALLTVDTSSAQDAFIFSGLLYADYSYTLKSPVAASEGENGFGYRRFYFTADYAQSERFSGRFRLEAADETTTEGGKPTPFVKDLYLKWKGVLGDGHDLVMGVSGPPSFNVSEKVWGYRSLEKTIQDRDKIVSSRDMGVTLTGRLAESGKVRYGLMVANNEGISAEVDKHKRLYGQLEFYPSESVSLTLGGDYSSFEDGSAVNINGFAGYTSSSIRAGIEAYLNPRTYDDMDESRTRRGATLFVIARASELISAIFRVDRSENEFLGQTETGTFLLGGLGFQVENGVEIIPNMMIEKNSGDDDPMVTGRITLFVTIK